MRACHVGSSFVSAIGLALLLGCGGDKDVTGAGGTGGSLAGQGGSGSGGHSGSSGGARGGEAGSGGQAGSGGRVGTGGQGGVGGAAGHGSGGSGPADSGVGPIGDGGPVSTSCTGTPWPTGDPTKAGPFQVTSDKNVGPLAGAVPDPVYGNTQQRFNVYRPADLAQGGYCHPIILWGNGHTDNPEPNPPNCLSANFCGDYKVIITQLASQGFVVIASLSTIVSQPDPTTGLLPQVVGLNWILQQSEDPTSPYYHHLDTAHIGATGHSEGGFATSVVGSDPRIIAIATMAGATAVPKLHGPALFLCGGQDTVVPCSTIQKSFDAVTTTPVMLEDNPTASHGSWIGSIRDPYQVAVTAWMRVHLMGDIVLRSMFYGATCQLCQNTQLMVQRTNMAQ